MKLSFVIPNRNTEKNKLVAVELLQIQIVQPLHFLPPYEFPVTCLLVFPTVLLFPHCKTSNLSPVKTSRPGSPSYHNRVTAKCGLTACLADECQKASLSRLTSLSVLQLFPVGTSLLPLLWEKHVLKKYTVTLRSVSLSDFVKLTKRFRNYVL